jgi:serine/threonine-protein kinase
VLRRLATGGTSDVLLARAEGPHGFERVVVLKLLLQQFREDEKFERMFAREAAAYARLSHPAIVKLYDFFSEGGQLVMVLEYVDGLPLNKLRALLKPLSRTLGDGASTFIAWRVFSALAAAHAAKDPQTGEFAPVIHRDVNPSNVLIPWDGHVKIADFGIAKVTGVDGETQTGFIKGTYGYMAPEQVRGEAVTIRADVYAACLLLWELLAGRKAIVRGSLTDLEVLRAMAEPSFPTLASLRPELPRVLVDAVARGLEPDPDRRAMFADELCNILRAAIDLEEGRRQLIDVLSGVRPPSMPDDLAATDSRPAVRDPAPSFADETIPNRLQVRQLSPDDTLTEAPKPAGKPVAKPGPPPPPAAKSQPPPVLKGSTVVIGNGSPSTRAAAPAAAPPTSLLRAPPPAPAQGQANQAPTLMGIAPTASRVSSRPPPPAVSPAQVARLEPAPPPPTPRMAPAASLGPSFAMGQTVRLKSAPSIHPPPPPPPPAPALAMPSVIVQSTARSTPVPVAAWTPPSAVYSSPPPADAETPPQRGHGWVFVVIAMVALATCGAVGAFYLTRGHADAAPVRATPSAARSVPASAAATTPPAATPTTATASPAIPPAASAPSTTAASSAAPAPAPTPSSAPPAAPDDPTMGQLTIPPSRGGHRVWIDNRLVGESPGSFPIRCGWHDVRVGSQGGTQHVNVACGDETVLH